MVPAISQPQPKIIKPRAAILALAGIAVHQEPIQAHRPVVWNQSEIPTNLMQAPKSISEAESTPVRRTPILSRIIPAKIRKPHTLRMYSLAA